MRDSFIVETEGRATVDITAAVARLVAVAEVVDGLCTVFCHHTSAALLICENADPEVRRDLEAWMARAVPDGDPIYQHTAEGSDDMPAHVRTALSQTSVGIPIASGRLDLGTWQGIYLWEHRRRGHRRRVSVVVTGA